MKLSGRKRPRTSENGGIAESRNKDISQQSGDGEVSTNERGKIDPKEKSLKRIKENDDRACILKNSSNYNKGKSLKRSIEEDLKEIGSSKQAKKCESFESLIELPPSLPTKNTKQQHIIDQSGQKISSLSNTMQSFSNRNNSATIVSTIESNKFVVSSESTISVEKLVKSKNKENDEYAKKQTTAPRVEDSIAGNNIPVRTSIDNIAPSTSPMNQISTLIVLSMLVVMFLLNIAATYTILAAVLTPRESALTPIASLLAIIATISMGFEAPKPLPPRLHPHIISPKLTNDEFKQQISNVTLREFLSHPDGFHLGLAPAFFGFYVYFGALTAFNEYVLTVSEQAGGKRVLPEAGKEINMSQNDSDKILLKSVAGASAGAMAACLLAVGLNPRESSEFVSTVTLDKFWDPPGFGGILKGNLFEEIMIDRLKRAKANGNEDDENLRNVKNYKLEESLIPVAVTVFDVLTMTGKTLRNGCMAKAARASACFPVLFQPVSWSEDSDDGDRNNDERGFLSSLARSFLPENLFIDGGILDPHGIVGLAALLPKDENKRIVNLAAGSFFGSGPPGPSMMPDGINTSEVLSISIENAPQCGPHKMENGPLAVQAAMNSIKAVLDVPLYHGKEKNHYILHVDAKAFIPSK